VVVEHRRRAVHWVVLFPTSVLACCSRRTAGCVGRGCGAGAAV